MARRCEQPTCSRTARSPVWLGRLSGLDKSRRGQAQGLAGHLRTLLSLSGNKDNLFCFSNEVISSQTSLRILIKILKSYILFFCMGVKILFWLFSFIPHFQAADSLHPAGHFSCLLILISTCVAMKVQEKALFQPQWVRRQGPILKEAVCHNFH